MNRGRTGRLVFLALLTAVLWHSPTWAREAGANNMKAYEVTYEYDPAFVDGPKMDWKGKKLPAPFKTQTTRIFIPDWIKEGDVIRGIMPQMSGFEDFARNNKVVFYDGRGNGPYGGPHKTFLKEAAKVTGHPELEHAGVILEGVSNLGRFAAHYAYFWPERVIAVILDHSCAPPGPTQKPTIYSYNNLPAAEGVPYFFNASLKNMYQDIDRRKCHYIWCTNAFKRENHPCTSVISFEDVGHGNAGTRVLQAVWLEEVMNLRVPAKISPEGLPYKLIPVDPRKMGGHVLAQMGTQDGHTIHTDVAVGPIGFSSKMSWWIPGPKSAAMYLEWVQKNQGKVIMDQAGKIPVGPQGN